jgi:hypothetical protein
VTAVSVAMTTFNGARFLGEQLRSIAAQTTLPAELVVTDDASDDDTVAILGRFAATAPFPVHVHINPVRLGWRANFMHALSLCRGELVALCDQDDVWEPAKLARMAGPFADPEVLLAFHEAWLIDADGRRGDLARIYAPPERNPPLSLDPMRNSFGFSMLVRRSLLGFGDLWELSVDNLHPDQRMAHDQWLFFLATALGTVAFVPEPLVGYRQHGGNAYGVDRQPRTALERAGRWPDMSGREFAAFTGAATARAAILDALALRLEGAGRDRAREAAAAYRAFARHAALRVAAYGALGLAKRLRGLVRMMRGGCYDRQVRWTFGRKAIAKDLLFLALPRRVTGALAAAGRTRA